MIIVHLLHAADQQVIIVIFLDGTVAFTGNNSFRHISCLVQFDIKAAGTLSDAVLTNLSLEGGITYDSSTSTERL